MVVCTSLIALLSLFKHIWILRRVTVLVPVVTQRGLFVQLQDRTQFSDGDLVQLRRFWNRGMTSLGFVCREKITAAANQLNVDTEIVKVSGTLVL